MQQLTLTRDEAYRKTVEQLGTGNLLKHVLAVEAGMRRLAEHLEQDVEMWGLTGLIHDLDYEKTKDDPDRHGFMTCEWLSQCRLPSEMLHAIKAHPGHIPCDNLMDWALYAVDPASGFIVACALMHPDKKLDAIDIDFMVRRFGEKRFAAGASRENMAACSNLGLTLEQFLILVQEGMLRIRTDLGL
ncbi:MAG TPA: HDIG domain-containing protein [candidate division Zixibacteria bacterium]|nr:HDIG domain-containing protein [candidate division Zixibacteria bacterium]